MSVLSQEDARVLANIRRPLAYSLLPLSEHRPYHQCAMQYVDHSNLISRLGYHDDRWYAIVRLDNNPIDHDGHWSAQLR